MLFYDLDAGLLFTLSKQGEDAVHARTSWATLQAIKLRECWSKVRGLARRSKGCRSRMVEALKALVVISSRSGVSLDVYPGHPQAWIQ